MGEISKVMSDLGKVYGVLSIGGMKDLCTKAGVPYREQSDSLALVRDLYEKGYKITIDRHNVPDVMVGQTLMLKDLDDNFIHGHQIWIDFNDDYLVKDNELFSLDDMIHFDAE